MIVQSRVRCCTYNVLVPAKGCTTNNMPSMVSFFTLLPAHTFCGGGCSSKCASALPCGSTKLHAGPLQLRRSRANQHDVPPIDDPRPLRSRSGLCSLSHLDLELNVDSDLASTMPRLHALLREPPKPCLTCVGRDVLVPTNQRRNRQIISCCNVVDCRQRLVFSFFSPLRTRSEAGGADPNVHRCSRAVQQNSTLAPCKCGVPAPTNTRSHQVSITDSRGAAVACAPRLIWTPS